MRRCFPGNERRRMPSSIVRIPWPGRKSITRPATRRKAPTIFFNINKVTLPAVFSERLRLIVQRCAKQSEGSFLTMKGIRRRLRKKVPTESPASQVKRTCRVCSAKIVSNISPDRYMSSAMSLLWGRKQMAESYSII